MITKKSKAAIKDLHPEQKKRVRHSKRFWILTISLSAAFIVIGLGVLILKTKNPISQVLYDRYIENGKQALEVKNYPRAAIMYRRALSLPNSDGSEWKKLAYAYQANKDYEQATEAYKEALRAIPETAGGVTTASTHNVLGNVYRDMEQYEEAEYHYREALRLRPGFTTVLVNLSHLYRIQTRYDEAIALLNNNYDGSEGMKVVGIQLAGLYRDNGQTSEAQSVISRVLAASPDDAQAIAVRDSL